ncbi:MAG TPA: DUF1259 domain-containing protein [Sphingomicrobium sp.]|nr:DUF1259 domain-containing protein [Sphingomicrobium sp.]
MRSIGIVRSLIPSIVPLLLLAAGPSAAQPAAANWGGVDQALGRAGATQPDGVRRYGFPRSDLHVVLDGITIKPALALGGWLAFQPMGANAVVMGDLVLTPDEVNLVMSELLKGGIQVTAIHNHLLRASPETIYMHVLGRGDPARLASTLHAALALSHTPLQPAPATLPTTMDLDIAGLDRVMGRAGKANGGVYQFTFPRAEMIMDGGMVEGASMGTATGINFQPVGSGRAAATGDFVLLGSEVDPVMRELRSHGFEVTALHSHMIGEQPSIYFMHFWGVGPATKLAASLRAALDRTDVQR